MSDTATDDPTRDRPTRDCPSRDHPPGFAHPPNQAHPAVALLRWPEDADERSRLAAAGEPRVLVLSDFSAPPSRLDDLELWLLDGAASGDILAAMETLRDRARAQVRPVLDADGLLWFDGAWVAVPDTQLPVVDLLVRNLDTVVADDELRRAYRAAGGSPRLASFRTQLHRIGRRVAGVGLRLRIVRREGAVLTAPARNAAPGS